MRILHVSDLHYRDSTITDQQVLLGAFMADVAAENQKIPVDVVVHTGDLTFSGKQAEFDGAATTFLTPLLEALNLGTDRLVLVRGNHDTDIAQIEPFHEQGLASGLVDRAEVNRLLDEQEALLAYHDRRGQAWRTFAESYLPRRSSPCGLGQVLSVDVDGHRVGIAALDSSWRATGSPDDADRGRLLIGDRQMRQAAEMISDAELRIFAFHHPVDWLAPFDGQDLRRTLERDGHIALSGHLHSSDPRALAGPAGSYVSSAAGSLYAGRDYPNAYSLLDIDWEASTVVIRFRTYQVSREVFDTGVDVVAGGEISFPLTLGLAERAELTDIEDRFAQARSSRDVRLKSLRERSVLADLLEDRNATEVNDLLVPPVLLPLPHDQFLIARDPKTRKRPPRLDQAALLDAGATCTVLVGDEASGLSSALDWVGLNHEASDKPVVKLSWSDIKGGNAGVERSLRLACFAHEIAIKQSDQLPAAIFLIDNMCDIDADERRLTRLIDHIAIHPKSIFVLGCRPGDVSLLRAALEESKIEYILGFLGPFGRSQLRELISRLDIAKSHAVYQSVTGLLEREGLARTPFIMAALVSVVGANEAFVGAGNETAVLDAYADLLLGRAERDQDHRMAMDYRDREHLLSSLAERMLKSQTAEMARIDVESFLLDYFRSIGWSEPVSTVVAALVDRRVLWEARDGMLAFRQPALLGLFAAKRLLDDENFKAIILRNPVMYPAIVRHAAALKRTDRELLMKVAAILTDSPTDEISATYFGDDLGDQSVIVEGAQVNGAQNAERLAEALEVHGTDHDAPWVNEQGEASRHDNDVDATEMDEIWDELHAKPVQDVVVSMELPPIWRFEKAICLVSSVLRSSELVADTRLKGDLLRDTLTAWAALAALVGTDESLNENARIALGIAIPDLAQEENDDRLEAMLSLLPIVITAGNIAIYLASRKLEGLLAEVLQDESFMSQAGPALMAILLTIEIRGADWLQHVETFIDRYQEHPSLLTAVEWVMYTVYQSKELVGRDDSRLENILVRLVIAEKGGGRPAPSGASARVAARLRRSRQQFGIRRALTVTSEDAPILSDEEA